MINRTFTARTMTLGGSVKIYDNDEHCVIATFATPDDFTAFVGMTVEAYNNQQAARAANSAPIESAAKLNRD